MSRGARCLGVRRRPRALEGGAGGGTHRPLWFEHGGGRSRGVGVRMAAVHCGGREEP